MLLLLLFYISLFFCSFFLRFLIPEKSRNSPRVPFAPLCKIDEWMVKRSTLSIQGPAYIINKIIHSFRLFVECSNFFQQVSTAILEHWILEEQFYTLTHGLFSISLTLEWISPWPLYNCARTPAPQYLSRKFLTHAPLLPCFPWVATPVTQVSSFPKLTCNHWSLWSSKGTQDFGFFLFS